MSDLHEDSPECRISICGRPVLHEGDVCWFHKSPADTEDAEIEAARVARAIDRSWDEYRPDYRNQGERYAHPEDI